VTLNRSRRPVSNALKWIGLSNKENKQMNLFTTAVLDQKQQLPMAVFHLTEQGPSVLYKGFQQLEGLDIKPKDLGKDVENLAVNLIAATAAGHQYVEGVFDFVLNNVKEYRLLVIALRIRNPNYIDPRLKTGYYHVVLFIPKWISKKLPSISKMDDHLLSTTRKLIRNSNHFYDENKLKKLKQQLTKIIISYYKN
jgi:hypothetical protein